MRKSLWGALSALLMVPATALAQDREPDVDEDDADEPLPEAKSDQDPAPPVPTPSTKVGGVVEQAGIGGAIGYGRAGVLELGGSAGFSASGDFTQITITPSVGWFVYDNIELSGLLSFSYVSTDDDDASLTTLLIEPSYHLPFNRTTFGFVGVGLGGAYVSGGPGLGFAMAPRIGANFMIGRSGILSPSISWQYTTQDSMDEGGVLVVSSAVAANIGYTVMW